MTLSTVWSNGVINGSILQGWRLSESPPTRSRALISVGGSSTWRAQMWRLLIGGRRFVLIHLPIPQKVALGVCLMSALLAEWALMVFSLRDEGGLRCSAVVTRGLMRWSSSRGSLRTHKAVAGRHIVMLKSIRSHPQAIKERGCVRISVASWYCVLWQALPLTIEDFPCI